MSLLFFGLFGVLLYVFALFPSFFMLLSLRGRKPPENSFEPAISFLIPAANESRHIAAKLENTLASDYPPEKVEVIVASDGSTDGTDDEVRSFGDPRVRLISLDSNRGKTGTINRLVEEAGEDILVMSDADVLISPNAIRNMMDHFFDPRISAVCGRRSSVEETVSDAGRPARLYNIYESAIKKGEGMLGRTLGGDGSLYALRKESFRPLPEHVPDDFVNILRVLESGGKVAYEERALSMEDLSDSNERVYGRRRRTVARGIRGLWSVRGLLNPFRFPLVSFLLFSHKVLRWGAGFIMIALFGLNVFLAGRPLFLFLLGGQLVVYGISFLPGFVLPGLPGKIVRTIRYFILSNMAAVAGTIDVVAGRDWSSWKVERS